MLPVQESSCFKPGTILEVLSVDDGFQGCWCDAEVLSQLDDQESGAMYRVRYIQFKTKGGACIEERVGSDRVRAVPPVLRDYEYQKGDLVDAKWRDGWWEGCIGNIHGLMKPRSCTITFPRHGHKVTIESLIDYTNAALPFAQCLKELVLSETELRIQLRYLATEREWRQVVMSARGDESSDSPERATMPVDQSLLIFHKAPRSKTISPCVTSSSHQASPARKRARTGSSSAATTATATNTQHETRLPALEMAPVFRPTAEQFKDPLAYITSIRDKAERFGICKVIPPSCWKPPWSIDSYKFKFNTRIQNIHELQERGEMRFYKQLKQYWTQAGRPLAVMPRFNGKQLDLFGLYRAVVRLGGHHAVSRGRRWPEIADTLLTTAASDSAIAPEAVVEGRESSRSTNAELLCILYSKYLAPFDAAMRGDSKSSASSSVVSASSSATASSLASTSCTVSDSLAHSMSTTTSTAAESTVFAREAAASSSSAVDTSLSATDLNGFAGSVQAVPVAPSSSCESLQEPRSTTSMKLQGPTLPAGKQSPVTQGSSVDAASSLATPGSSSHAVTGELKKALEAAGVVDEKDKQDQICEVCCKDEDPDHMLLCDTCDGGYHMSCLRPKVKEVPKGDWHCQRCRQTQAPVDEPFGFEDGPQYTLSTFHTLAQSYKARWFSGANAPHNPTKDDIERGFWDIVEGRSNPKTVQVLYGSDLPTVDYGSGFPLNANEQYSSHKWNLNVMPTLPGSLLRHLGKRVSGLVAPWMYVGMLFSSFCWHNEDNYLYSINYMHWGSTKTWYGIPGDDAEKFEAVMRQSIPELFSSAPDLLFDITTMLSPRIIHDADVPCYKIHQEQGQFVVTFPKSYHAGFSHGFNCCEAVNFATADWLPHGQDATAAYRKHAHIPAFSITKLLCSIAEADFDCLAEDGSATLQLVAKILETVVDEEAALRSACLKAGIKERPLSEAPSSQMDGDDEDGRLCSKCKQNCFLSFVTCECDGKIESRCLHHFDCSQRGSCLQTLYTTRTLDQLHGYVHKLREAAIFAAKKSDISPKRRNAALAIQQP